MAALDPPAGLADSGAPVGTRLPMTAGSGAKVLLAYSDTADQQAVLPMASFTIGRWPRGGDKRGWGAKRRRARARSGQRLVPVRDGGWAR